MLFPISKQGYLNYASINKMAFHLRFVLSTIQGITPGWQKSLCNLSLTASYVSSMLGLTIFLQLPGLASQQITDFDVKGVFHVLPQSPHLHLLPLEEESSSHPTLHKPFKNLSDHYLQSFLLFWHIFFFWPLPLKYPTNPWFPSYF